MDVGGFPPAPGPSIVFDANGLPAPVRVTEPDPLAAWPIALLLARAGIPGVRRIGVKTQSPQSREYNHRFSMSRRCLSIARPCTAISALAQARLCAVRPAPNYRVVTKERNAEEML